MKQIIIICSIASVLIFIMSSLAFGQYLEFSGYYENQLSMEYLNSKTILQDYNKLRLDLNAKISESISFNGDYIYRTYHGKKKYSMLDWVPEKFASQILDSLRSYYDFKYKNDNYLDNAYVTLYFKWATIRVGKQQLPWGTGYAWNPTDAFNRKNIMDPTYEVPGVNALKVEIPFSSEGSLTGIFGPENEFKNSTKAVKIKDNFGMFDVSITFSEIEWQMYDYINFVQSTERRRLYGVDFSGQLFSLGIWGEGAYNNMEISKDYGQYLLGIDYTFESGLYLIAEYLRNELGESKKERYGLNDWLKFFSGEKRSVGRDMLFTGFLYPLTDLLEYSNYFIMNLDDGSFIINPWFTYSLAENTQLVFSGYICLGKKNTEYGEFPNSAFVRVRVYF